MRNGGTPWPPLESYSHQMICKQHIVLNHLFSEYESNLEIQTRNINDTILSLIKM